MNIGYPTSFMRKFLIIEKLRFEKVFLMLTVVEATNIFDKIMRGGGGYKLSPG